MGMFDISMPSLSDIGSVAMPFVNPLNLVDAGSKAVDYIKDNPTMLISPGTSMLMQATGMNDPMAALAAAGGENQDPLTGMIRGNTMNWLATADDPTYGPNRVAGMDPLQQQAQSMAQTYAMGAMPNMINQANAMFQQQAGGGTPQQREMMARAQQFMNSNPNFNAGQVSQGYVGNYGQNTPRVGEQSVGIYGQNAPQITAPQLQQFGQNVPQVSVGQIGNYGQNIDRVTSQGIESRTGQIPQVSSNLNLPQIREANAIRDVNLAGNEFDTSGALNRGMSGDVSDINPILEQQRGSAQRAYGDMLSSASNQFNRDILPQLQAAQRLPQQAAKQFLEQIAPELRSGAISSGQYGSSRDNLNRQLAAERLGERVLEQTGDIAQMATLTGGGIAEQLAQQAGRFGESFGQSAAAEAARAYENAQDRAVNAAGVAGSQNIAGRGLDLEAQTTNQGADITRNAQDLARDIARGDQAIAGGQLDQAGQIANQNAALTAAGIDQRGDIASQELAQNAQSTNAANQLAAQRLMQTGDIARTDAGQNAQAINAANYLASQGMGQTTDLAQGQMDMDAQAQNAANYFTGQNMRQTGDIARGQLAQNAQQANAANYLAGQGLQQSGDIARSNLQQNAQSTNVANQLQAQGLTEQANAARALMAMQGNQQLYGQQTGLMNAIPGLMDMGLRPSQVIGSIGDFRQNQAQNELNDQVARHQFDQTAPIQNTMTAAQINGLMPQYQPPPNPLLTGLGGAATGAGIGSMIAPGMGTAIGAGIGGLAGLFGGGYRL